MAKYSRFDNYSRIRVDILAEHLDEAEFLFGQRRRALRSPDYTPKDLAKLEARLDAHLDGLAVGGRRTVELLADEMATGEQDRAAAVVAGLLAADEAAGLELVEETLAAATPEAALGMAEAIGGHELTAPIESVVRDSAAEGEANGIAAACLALSEHGAQLPPGIAAWAAHEDAFVRAATATAFGRCGDSASLAVLLDDDDVTVGREALEALAVADAAAALARLRADCAEDASEWQIDLLARLGTEEDVPFLLGAMTGTRAAAAGEAFARITGCELPTLPPPEQGDEEEDATFEDLRPLPDAEACKRLWSEKQATTEEKS